MPRQRFSDMLSSRRRQLGLSIEQASRILRLREDVLIAFEEGDFERMPQSGYAQGMLSSYARYLGLDPRRITDLFQEELESYVNEVHPRPSRRGHGSAGDLSSRPKAYVEYHGLLPTSGGPAGDLGAFATTTPARTRRSLPLAGSGPSAVDAYESGGYGYGDGGRQRRPYNSNRQRPDAGMRPASSSAERQRRRSYQQRRAYGAGDADPNGSYGENQGYGAEGRYRRDDVSTRSIRPREYTDDMRYDEQASPYERASTISGRRSSRNIANMERPNVRRRSGSDYAPGGRSRAGQGGRGGSDRGGRGRSGVLADQQRSIFAIILVFAVVLTAILVFSVSSCVNSRNQGSDQAKSVSVNSVDQGSKTSTGSGGSGASGSGTSSQTTAQTTQTTTSGTAAQDGSATSDSSTYTPTVVKISVASGAYTWLEVTNDGVSVVAESVTGPWEQEFTVTDNLSVQAGDPSSVTVTNNGKAVSFTSKASGLGSLSVKGTKPPETTATTTSTDADATASSAGSASSATAGE